MNESAPPERASAAHRVVKFAGSALAKVWGQLKRFHRPIAAIAAFGALLSGLLGYWSAYEAVEKVAVPKPTSAISANFSAREFSVAILTFSADRNDVSEEHLADALTTDVTSSLTQGMPWASVVSSSVVGSYKEKRSDVRAVGRELNVRYVMEGAVRVSGDSLDLRAWLTEVATGTEVWTDNVKLNNAADASDRQQVIAQLTQKVRYALVTAERRRVLALPVSTLTAEELTTRADAIWQQDPEPSLKMLDEARSLYNSALKLDPALPAALMSQANVLAEILDRDPRSNRDSLLREYDQMSLRLIAAADRESRAWNIRADALQRQWRWDAALEANAKALRLDPTRLGTMGQRAHILNDMGRPEEALAVVDEAFLLQPAASFAGWLSLNRCRATLALGRYDDAVAACEQAASAGDSYYRRLSPHPFLTAAYALQGNNGRAQAEKAKLLAQWPGTSIARMKASPMSDVPAYLEQTETHLYAGLRKAGIPEQ